MLETKEFYYVNCEEPFFIIKLDMFTSGPLPILWHNQGLYGLISLEWVANAIRYLKDSNKSSDLFWIQTQSINPIIGDQLTNKQFDYKTEGSES